MTNKHLQRIVDRLQGGIYFIVKENLLHSITGKIRKGGRGGGLSLISLNMACPINQKALTSVQFMSFTEIPKSPLSKNMNIYKQHTSRTITVSIPYLLRKVFRATLTEAMSKASNRLMHILRYAESESQLYFLGNL